MPLRRHSGDSEAQVRVMTVENRRRIFENVGSD
jgi:predicted metal-dependent phosphotriesterase family hydrolase